MKTPQLTSLKSTTSSTIETDDQSEFCGDSCYYPGCQKDANCKCEICLASINATLLDLIIPSSQKNSLTTFSTSKPIRRNEATYNHPIAYNSSILSTPVSRNPPRVDEDEESTARVSKDEELKNPMNRKNGKNAEKRDYGFGDYWFRLILLLGVILAVEFGGSWVISSVLKTDLSADLVTNVGEKTRNVNEVIEKLGCIQKELKSVVNGKVANLKKTETLPHCFCIPNARCTDRRQRRWPLQTVGLTTTRFAPRSFTLLLGRVTEWSDGKVRYAIRQDTHHMARCFIFIPCEKKATF